MNLTRAIRALPPAVAGGLGFWLGLGTVSPDPGGSARIGVLAPWWALAVLVVTPIAIAAVSDRRRRRVQVWWLGAVGVLPWLPIPHVSALLLPQGPLMWAVLAAALAVTLWPSVTSAMSSRPARPAPDARR